MLELEPEIENEDNGADIIREFGSIGHAAHELRGFAKAENFGKVMSVIKGHIEILLNDAADDDKDKAEKIKDQIIDFFNKHFGILPSFKDQESARNLIDSLELLARKHLEPANIQTP